MKANIVKFFLLAGLLPMSAWVSHGITLTKPNIVDDGRLIQIPVVFHVLYIDSSQDNGINAASRNNGNSSQYIPKEKIMAELADFDMDFQQKNPDISVVNNNFKNVIGNPKVHFYLKGLIYTPISSWGKALQGTNTGYLHSLSPIVDPDKCLNVYIGKIKYNFGGTDGVTPVRINDSDDQTDDAVNLSYSWVGLHYRLLSHETGHWLGLWHTFDERQFTDGITDIPVQAKFTEGNCYLCPPDVREQRSLDANFQHTNYNNFMDYSGCRVMFSVLQAKKIRQVVQDYRPSIWNNSAH